MITIPPFKAISTTAVSFASVPPGVCAVVVSNTGANTAYIGTSSAVTATSGFPLPAGATVTLPGFPASSAVNLYAICTTAQTAVVGAIISTAA